MNFKEAFNSTQILNTETNSSGEYTYYPFGRAIRQRYVKEISNLLDDTGFEEWHFNDFIPVEEVEKMNNKVMDVTKNVYKIHGVNKNKSGEFFLAPTHEIPIANTMSQHINNESQLPIHFYHVGPAFRKQYRTKFPFNLSKRNTYIECYGMYKDRETLEGDFDSILALNEHLFKDILMLPYLVNERPLITNKPISRKTITLDVITRLNRTLHAGMIYDHDNIFNSIYNVRYRSKMTGKNTDVRSLHFGFTDNSLMATILESFDENTGSLILPESLTPYHVVCYDNVDIDEAKKLKEQLGKFGVRLKINRNQGSIKKQIGLHDKQGVMIQIRKIEDGIISFRVGGIRGWHESTANELHLSLEKIQTNRVTERTKRVEKIKQERIVNCYEVSVIQNQVNEGKIVDCYLEKNDNALLGLESQLEGCEVLGYRDIEVEGNSIYTGQPVNTKVYISKRI